MSEFKSYQQHTWQLPHKVRLKHKKQYWGYYTDSDETVLLTYDAEVDQWENTNSIFREPDFVAGFFRPKMNKADLVFDLEGSMGFDNEQNSVAITALYLGLRLVEEQAKRLEAEAIDMGKGPMIHLTGGEAYGLRQQLQEQYPNHCTYAMKEVNDRKEISKHNPLWPTTGQALTLKGLQNEA